MILENNVPCHSADLNLTCDLVEASEYSSSGIRLFSDKTSITDQYNECTNSGDDDWHERRNFYSSCDDEFERTAPPLIRSNSYTLESPSPVLLAHLRSMGLESSFGDEHTFQTFTSPDSAKSNFETEDKPFIDGKQTEDALTVETSEQNDGANTDSKTTEQVLNLSDSVYNETAAESSNRFQLDSAHDRPNLEKKTDLVVTQLDIELLKALNTLALNEKEQILLLLKSRDCGSVQMNSEAALITNSPYNQENNISVCSDASINFPCVVTRTSKFSETKIDIFDESDNFITEKTVSNTIIRNILNCSKNLFDDSVWLQKASRQVLITIKRKRRNNCNKFFAGMGGFYNRSSR